MTASKPPLSASVDAIDQIRALLRESPQRAVVAAQALLTTVPEDRHIRLLLAVAHQHMADFESALAVTQPLTAEFAEWGQAHFEHARALLGSGRQSEALAALQRAVSLQPKLPSAWRLLADQWRASGNLVAANEAYLKHVTHMADEPRLREAAQALSSERYADAERLLRAHLRIVPSDVAALQLLADVMLRLKRDAEAERLLELCLALAPGFVDARVMHARVLHRLNRPAEALAVVRQLNTPHRMKESIRSIEAASLSRVGDNAGAIAIYESLLAERADSLVLWLAYGHALKAAGLTPKAIAAYRKCIKLRELFGEAWWSLANLKTFRFSWADIATMRAALARTDIDETDRLHFEFSLGKALEDVADYASSFTHYARGNALRRASQPHDGDVVTRHVEEACKLLDTAFFSVRADWGCTSPEAIFILGLPRSGSTLIEQILASHPLVEGTMELPELPAVARRMRLRGREQSLREHEALQSLTADTARALGEEYLVRTRAYRHAGRPFFIDKLPNNWLHVGLIKLILPKAKIIDIRRHPLACGWSNFKQQFAAGQTFAYDLIDFGCYYRDYATLMKHFEEILPGAIHRVIYEQLVENPEAEIRRLLDYCGLAFDPACLRFHETTRSVRTASSEQVRRPINREGLEQWRHYEPWLAPLKTELGLLLERYPEMP